MNKASKRKAKKISIIIGISIVILLIGYFGFMNSIIYENAQRVNGRVLVKGGVEKDININGANLTINAPVFGTKKSTKPYISSEYSKSLAFCGDSDGDHTITNTYSVSGNSILLYSYMESVAFCNYGSLNNIIIDGEYEKGTIELDCDLNAGSIDEDETGYSAECCIKNNCIYVEGDSNSQSSSKSEKLIYDTKDGESVTITISTSASQGDDSSPEEAEAQAQIKFSKYVETTEQEENEEQEDEINDSESEEDSTSSSGDGSSYTDASSNNIKESSLDEKGPSKYVWLLPIGLIALTIILILLLIKKPRRKK